MLRNDSIIPVHRLLVVAFNLCPIPTSRIKQEYTPVIVGSLFVLTEYS